MKFRFKAFAIHLLSSAAVLSLIFGALYLGWYRWPAWYLLGVLSIVGIMAVVDVVLGPVLTFAIASPTKPRRELARDVGIIVAVQLAALAYATHLLWSGRPLYYTFSADRLEVVRAFEIEPQDAAAARQFNAAFAPHWYSLPRRVWAEMPADPAIAGEIIQSAVGGGPDIVNMPRYFKTWEEGFPELRKQLRPVAELRSLSNSAKTRAAERARELGIDVTQANALLFMGRSAQLVALFDPTTMQLVATVKSL